MAVVDHGALLDYGVPVGRTCARPPDEVTLLLPGACVHHVEKVTQAVRPAAGWPPRHRRTHVGVAAGGEPVGQVVGRLLPLAAVVAMSPVPIVAVVLVLLAPRAGGAGTGFLVGWIVGIAGVTSGVLLLAGGTGPGGNRSSGIASFVEIGLGGLLLVLAARQWGVRPKDGEQVAVPTWLAAIDRVTVVRAGGLGLLLSAANPKALLVCVAAGLAIAGEALPAAQNLWSVVVFTAIAASTVAVLVLARAVGGVRIARPLSSLRAWLTVHSAGATAGLLGLFGVVLIAQGVGGLV